MNIKETFLNLTQYTIPHGKENILRKYLPDGVKSDSYGNYYITIGKSDTLFTSHLDTYCTEMEKVNHVIEGNIIKTDGNTILGGDNKTGVCILLNMIENNVPGTYYFFAGEEPTAKDGGLYGSKNALRSNSEYFKRFKRAICFDRKKEGSIITRQMARFTCSEDFVNSIIEEFSKFGLDFQPDQTGWYTDVAVFIDTIPEITNLSSGTYNEHTPNEYVDIEYLQKVANAAVQIDWESLPVVRVAKKETSKTDSNLLKFKKFNNFKNDKLTFNTIDNYMDMFGFKCLNDYEFEPGLDMIFSRWHEEVRVHIKIEDGIIYINDKKIGSLKDFEKYVGITLEHKIDIDQFIDELENMLDDLEIDEIDIYKFNKFLTKYKITFEDFKEYYYSKDSKFKDVLEYDVVNKKIKIIY